MKGFVAPTDHGWYQFLQARPELDEVNFWRPSPRGFAALSPGEFFFFKLKGRHNAIGGFGQFARFARLPVWQAWDVFGLANGTPGAHELLGRLGRLTAASRGPVGLDAVIGCLAIAFPVFFTPDEWVRVPRDWPPQTQSGKTYDLTRGEGRRLLDECFERAIDSARAGEWEETLDAHRRGKLRLMRPRLGQYSFRLAVRDAYGGACAVTEEHSLPVLEAAHIRPWSERGPHEVRNGLLLRRDLHRLFDLGFVTVRPDHTLAVSPQLRDTYANGRTYYALEGRRIHVPRDPDLRPAPDLLAWHEATLFRAS